MSGKTTRKDIENALMRGADTLRDTIDAANYKDYVLPVMFLKYLSDSYNEEVDKLKRQYEGVRLERQKRYLPLLWPNSAPLILCMNAAFPMISAS